MVAKNVQKDNIIFSHRFNAPNQQRFGGPPNRFNSPNQQPRFEAPNLGFRQQRPPFGGPGEHG